MQDRKNETRAADTQGPSHGCVSGTEHDRGVPEIDMLSPLSIGGLQLRNRIVMSPMCQYQRRGGHGERLAPGTPRKSSRGGSVADHGRGDCRDAGRSHLARRPGNLDRRTHRAVGSDRPVRPTQGAGRRHSACARRSQGEPRSSLAWRAQLRRPEQGGWTVIGPSPIPFRRRRSRPRWRSTKRGSRESSTAFEAAARRALVAGFR